MIKVNLVPPEILAKARQKQLMLQAAVVGTFLCLILVLVSLGHWFGLVRLQHDFDYKQAKLTKLSAIVAQVEELEKAAAAVRARLGVIEDLLKGRSFYPLFMSQFARTVPSGVRVMQMNTSASGNGELKLTITAQGNNNEDVATWLKTLETDPHFAGVELGAVSPTGTTGRAFTITATYNGKL